MRHHLQTKILALLLSLLTASGLLAQTGNESSSAMSYLKSTFPQLTELYEGDLANCHTHYIFVVDVSGSMVKYDEIVTPAIKAFAMALPLGEQVSVIPFGTDAKQNIPGLCCKIQGYAQKQVLVQSLSGLYVNDSYTSVFRGYTDIEKAVAAVNKTLLNNQEMQMNVIVMISDFLNCVPDKGDTKLSDGVLKALNKDFDNVTSDCYTRVVALQLPPAGSNKGFCLDQLQNEVFCNTTSIKRFDIVPAIKDVNAISHWFDQLSKDIMTDKLRAVIQLDNARSLHPVFKTNIDIDGNTTAEIHWTPNKLYNKIKIDSTYVGAQSDFVFVNNKKVWKESEDTVIKDLKLGQLKHKGWGFWNYDEVLNIGLSLPTPYDAELKKLSIDKPIPETSETRSGWLFTFLLPLWLTALLTFLLIFYIIQVFKAFKRNRSERFIGEVEIYNDRGRQIGNTISVRVPAGSTLLIGLGGSHGCDVNGAAWTLKLDKKCSSALLFWKKPAFEWRATSGYAQTNVGSKKRGLLSRYGQGGTKRRFSIDCGPQYDRLTHNVSISISKNN